LGIGGTSISLAVARHLIKNDVVSIDKVKTIHKFLNSRKNIPKNRNNPDGEYIAWMLHGGSHAMEWSKNMVDAIKQVDEKQLSYFDDGELVTFPYKSIGDINPALKGMSPPISLSQANKIAEVADSIGVSEEKNGWAIAISNFRKTHRVENGKWIKKESASQKEEIFVENEEKELEKKEEMAEEKIPETSEEKKEPEKEEMAVEEKVEDEKSEKEEEKSEAEEEVKEEVEEKKEVKEEKMSLDANLDVAAYLAFLEATTEANEEMVAKYKTGEEFDYGKIFAASKEKMCKMAEELDKAKGDNDAYMSMKEEFEALKQFKAETESAKVAYAVESTIAEASDVLPKEKVEEFRGRAKDYTVDTVSGLTNEIKAFAFSCSKDHKPSDGIVRMATGWVPAKQSSSLENGWVPK
jgi:outer membrane biosynthesis protein TonB